MKGFTSNKNIKLDFPALAVTTAVKVVSQANYRKEVLVNDS